MESIDSESICEATTQAKRSITGLDRITLGAVESQRLSTWLDQISGASKGFLSLSKSELVNFLLREHRLDLTPKEIQRLRSAHYDPIKHLNWIAPQIKKALQENNIHRVAELQLELRRVELSIGNQEQDNPDHRTISSTRRRRRKNNDSQKITNADVEESDNVST